MLVHFDSPRICLHDGGSICLVPPDPFYRYFRSGDRFIGSPKTALGGTESHVTPAPLVTPLVCVYVCVGMFVYVCLYVCV